MKKVEKLPNIFKSMFGHFSTLGMKALNKEVSLLVISYFLKVIAPRFYKLVFYKRKKSLH